MAERVIIIGGGHNGLAAAFYLAKAGIRPLVLERQPDVGGGATTREIHPGFWCPALSHETLLHEQIVRDMDLRGHGLEFLSPAVEVCALAPDGPPLVLGREAADTAAGDTGMSPQDADAYAGFRATLGRLADVVAVALTSPPPDVERPTAGDLWTLLTAGRRFRGLGRRDEHRLLRWLTMPAADLVHEWFASELLRATMAAPGLSGTRLGPRSAGSALVLLLREASRRLAGGTSVRVRGGPGALARAMAAAARAAGAEIRTGHAVERIVVRDGRVVGVRAEGRDIAADDVLSAVDPKTTFLKLVDPLELTPDFASKLRNYRASGTLAKVNLALSALPRFTGIDNATVVLSGRIHIGPTLDYLERAYDHVKYGEFSSAPWLDMTIPSILDPALAPAGAHVASVYVHYAPYALRGSEWSASTSALLATVVQVLEGFAPGVGRQIVEAQVVSPADLESQHGLWGGHVFHGELAIDQLFTMRPLLGHARYASPIHGLYLCGAGTHPGGFMSGTSGRLAAREIVKKRP